MKFMASTKVSTKDLAIVIYVFCFRGFYAIMHFSMWFLFNSKMNITQIENRTVECPRWKTDLTRIKAIDRRNTAEHRLLVSIKSQIENATSALLKVLLNPNIISKSPWI